MSITVTRHKSAPRLNPSVRIKPIRKDGKHPVTYYYPGEPNMFGGYNHGRSYNKLHTADQIRGGISSHYNIDNESNGTFSLEVPSE